MPKVLRTAALKTAALFLASLCVSAAMLEGGARLSGRFPLFQPADDGMQAFNKHLGDVYLPDPELGYVLNLTGPNARFGFMNGAEYGDAKEPAQDVVVIGDSIFFSQGLEKGLKRKLPQAGFRVWNIGLPGYNTSQELRYLKTKVSLKPDVIVLGFCVNDFQPSMMIVDEGRKAEFRTELFSPMASTNPFLFKHSAAYRMIKLVLGTHGWRHSEFKDTYKRHRLAVRDALAGFKRYASEKNAELIVVAYPLLLPPEESHKDDMREHFATALELLRELGIKHLDAGEALPAEKRRQYWLTKEDYLHPNDLAQQLVAAKLVQKFPREFAAD